MVDIEHIRKNPNLYEQAILAKNIPLDLGRLLYLDVQRRKLSGEVEQLRRTRNNISQRIASHGDGQSELMLTAKNIGNDIKKQEAELNLVEAEFNTLMTFVPGLPLPIVPIGKSDENNIEIRRQGHVNQKSFALKDHLLLAAMHKMLELDGPRQIAGSRAYALTGNGALLEMAVLRFALDKILAKGFTLVSPPLLVKDIAMYGTGYFPLGEDNAYYLEHNKLYLTGTCEVGIASLNINRTFDLNELPLRYVGISPCFRSEAGAAGRDTKGLYRVHQFQKVEQVVFCGADQNISEQEHFNLLNNAEEILQALELPYRVVLSCTAELGLGQVFKHDIETWMPSRNSYGETHSCSSFHDFQARRLNIRYKDNQGRKIHVHTLNNTAIATPRILIPLLENHQNEDGSINIPEVLRPYLGGRKLLEPEKNANGNIFDKEK